MATMNISLPDRLKQWVEEQVATGRFANASDYVRDLIRREEERERVFAELRALAEEGRASGMSEKSLDQVIEEAKKRGRAAVKGRDAA